MITEIFLAVCAHTSLVCEDISVEFKKLPPYTQAQAYETNTGRMGIWISDEKRNRSEYFYKDLFVHEIAHLVRYTEKSTGMHDRRFREICKELAKAVDVKKSACRAHS